MERFAKWTQKGFIVRPVSDEPVKVIGAQSGDVLFEGVAGLAPIPMHYSASREELIVEAVSD